jgi:hypothetical protein
VFAGVGERTREGNDLYHEMIEGGVIKLGAQASKLYTIQPKPHALWSTPCTPYTLCVLYPTLRPIPCVSCTLHPIPYALDPIPYSLYSIPHVYPSS